MKKILTGLIAVALMFGGIMACNQQESQNKAASDVKASSTEVSTTSIDGTKKSVKKARRSLEGTVQTRIGALEFINGYPSDQTIDKLYNEMDFQRAVQAYLWGLPMVEMAEWQKAQKDISTIGRPQMYA
jgi:hypothetical protein